MMPKDTQIEIYYDELKKLVRDKYEKNKGFKIAAMREIDIIDYLEMLMTHNIDNFVNLRDIITETEVVGFKNDLEIITLLNKVISLKN
jgi:hypothetical protein